MSRWRTWSLRVAPYAVTAAVVAAILHRYPAAEIAHQMAAGHALRMLPIGLALPFVVWLPYAACDRVIFEGAIGPVPYREVVRAKAASAVLQTLGYFFGGGGYAVWVARTTRSGPARAAGAVLYLMASDLIAVCTVAGASMWLAGAEALPAVRTAATWIFGVQVGFIVFGPTGAWLRLPQVFEPWRTVPRLRSAAQIAGRALNIATITAFTWWAMRAFGLEVPARAAAMYVPVILLVTSLPINVAGLGAAQAAWLLFLPWATGPKLLAFQVIWNLCSGLGVLARGLPFVRGVLRQIEDGAIAGPQLGA
ncbi:MAG: hypothetical protein ACRENE_07735 [Polyangiaceae bacterium]